MVARLSPSVVALILSLLLFFGLAFVPGVRTPGGFVAVLLLAVASAPMQWGAVHESIHGKLFESERLNRIGGRVLASFLGYSWDAVRFGHLAHHRFNRHPLDRPDELDPARPRLPQYIRFYVALVAAPLGSAAYGFTFLAPRRFTERLMSRVARVSGAEKVAQAGRVYFLEPARRVRIRQDCALVVLLFGFALWCWGSSWPVFVAAVAARWIVISLADNAPHYATPRDSGSFARNTRWPRALSWTNYHNNLHGIHHLRPDLAWNDLPQEFRRRNARYDGGWPGSLLVQFRGPRVLSGEFVP